MYILSYIFGHFSIKHYLLQNIHLLVWNVIIKKRFAIKEQELITSGHMSLLIKT